MLHQLTRRNFLGTLAALAGGGVTAGSVVWAKSGFSFDHVLAKARALAKNPYDPPYLSLPDRFDGADYNTYRKINYRREAALWRGGPVEAQFFHPGHRYRRGVEINAISNGSTVSVPFDSGVFEYRGIEPPKAHERLQYSGFRLHSNLNSSGYKDEYAVFQGGSYFRLIGKEQVYGASGRGIAINTATSSSEEFPHFRAFWLEQPSQDISGKNSEITIYGLLDGPSVVGAYKFDLTAGLPTRLAVEATLFFRKPVEKLGLGAMTSMFFNPHKGLREHDSDMLLIHNGAGEQLLRPLHNPGRVTVSSFFDDGPRGFGLMQRHRVADDFTNREYAYEHRPSFWLTPRGNWGHGHVELLELPTTHADYDNIGAYWVPNTRPSVGDEVVVAYDLEVGTEPDVTGHLGRVIASHFTPSGRFHLRFERPKGHGAAGEKPRLALSSTAGSFDFQSILPSRNGKGWDVDFAFHLPEGGVADLRCRIEVAGRPITETWTFPFEKGVS